MKKIKWVVFGLLGLFTIIAILGASSDGAKKSFDEEYGVGHQSEKSRNVEGAEVAVAGENDDESKSDVNSVPADASVELIKVIRVIDGDTVEIEGGQKVRYIGIDTPETVHPSKPVECFGKEASNKNRELVLDKQVKLEKDVSEIDKYGRLLRYVWTGDVLVNELLVREGYAQSSTYPPDVRHQDRFVEAQRLARKENKGLWTQCSYFGEAVTSTPLPSETAGQNQTGTCKIKGNISYNTGEKIYHISGCQSYEKTQINESKGERWFCTEQEAIAAGWRKAKNCP